MKTICIILVALCLFLNNSMGAKQTPAENGFKFDLSSIKPQDINLLLQGKT